MWGEVPRCESEVRRQFEGNTGCMATCMGVGQMNSLGIKRRDLLIPEMNMKAANETGIHVVGVTFLEMKGRNDQG